jgi:hypothetical protein
MLRRFGIVRCGWGTYASYLFFCDTHRELEQPTPDFPPPAIWTIRCANVALNSLNYYWCAADCVSKTASHSMCTLNG